MKSYPSLLFFKILILFNATLIFLRKIIAQLNPLSVPSGINIELSGE